MSYHMQYVVNDMQIWPSSWRGLGQLVFAPTILNINACLLSIGYCLLAIIYCLSSQSMSILYCLSVIGYYLRIVLWLLAIVYRL